jgi:ribosomal protein S20
MPVTKTAKRALRSSKKKEKVNSTTLSSLEIAVRQAKKAKTVEKIRKAVSLADRAAKKKAIHKNKANRIKRVLAKLTPQKGQKDKAKKKITKKTAK